MLPPYEIERGHIHLSIGYLAVLKKSDPSFPNNHQQPVAPQLGVGFGRLLHSMLESFNWLDLVQ